MLRRKDKKCGEKTGNREWEIENGAMIMGSRQPSCGN